MNDMWTVQEKKALKSLEALSTSEKFQYLKDIGIYDESGNLTKRYGGTKTDTMAQLSKEFNYTHAFGIYLWDVKNQMNVGASIRAAGAFGANFVNIIGNRWKKRKHPDWRNLDTEMARKKMPIFMGDDLVQPITPYGFKIIAVERGKEKSYLSFEHPRRAIYVFGPEDGQVPKMRYDDAISIPSSGSLNLAACVNIILASRYSQDFDVHNRPCVNCGSENVSLKNSHCNSCGGNID